MTKTAGFAGLVAVAISSAVPTSAGDLEMAVTADGQPIVTNVDSSAAAALAAATPGPDDALQVVVRDDVGGIQAGRARYRPLVERAAAQYGLSVRLVEAVIEVESGFNPSARSSKGASGLMQLMPETARSLGVVDIWDPAANIDGGTRYLADLLQQFRGDRRLALAGYNAGPNAVVRAGGIPRYPETIDYVRKVETILGVHHAGPAARSTLRTVRRNDGSVHITNLGHTQSSLRLLRDHRGSLTLTNR